MAPAGLGDQVPSFGSGVFVGVIPLALVRVPSGAKLFQLVFEREWGLADDVSERSGRNQLLRLRRDLWIGVVPKARIAVPFAA